MKVLVVLFLAIASASASMNYMEMLPVAPLFHPEERITNGKAAAIADYPFQAGLNVNGGWCGGSLISTTYVVTAAHCVDGVAISNINVYLGSATRQGGTQRTAVSKIVHASYNSNTLVNDIALVQIAAVTYSTNIKNVDLPAIGVSSTYDGSAVIASGWGKTTDTSSVASTLQYADLTVITNTLCASTYGTSTIKSSTLCVSTPSGTSTCNGDSGGPLVLKSSKLLVGITSFVASAGCTKGYPAGFTRVTSYRQWIKDNSGV